MTSFILVLLTSVVCLLCFSVYAIASYLHARFLCRRAIGTVEISKQIILLSRDIARKQSSLKKYQRIEEYLSGTGLLFKLHLTEHRLVKVQRVTTFDEERIALLKEYEVAPKEIKKLVIRYSELLKMIYKYNHPVKFAFEKTKLLIIRFSLRVMVVFLELILKVLEYVKPTNRLSEKEVLSHTSDYQERVSTETGLIRVAA